MRIQSALVLGVIFVFSVLPTLAQRNVPAGADPAAVLEAYFSELKELIDAPETTGLGLVATRGNVGSYWIATSTERVQQTGQVADLNSVMLFKMKRPAEWTIEAVREAGDFARASVVFMPSASMGIVRDGDYEPIEASYNLVRHAEDWFIINFEGPEVTPPPEDPEPIAVSANGTPDTLVTQFMDLIVAELGPANGAPGSADLRRFSIQVEDMWIDERESRRSLGQNLAMLAIMQPQSWSLVDSTVTGDTAQIRVSTVYGSPMAATMPASLSGGATPQLNFRARRTDGTWKLETVRR